MRGRAAVFAAIVVGVLGVTTTPTLRARFDVTPIGKSEIDRRLESATVSVIALGCDLALNSGTGVAVTGDEVLTNRHVVARFRTLHLVYDATPARMLTPALVGTSAGNDVAVLRPGRLGVEPIALAAHDPRPGEALWVSGYAHERTPDSLPDGLVVARAHVIDYVAGRATGERGPVMRLDVPVRPGMSGGPVLDETGRVAGLVFAVQNPDQGLVIPVSSVRRALAGPLLPPARC
jgi:S1-C subfamily serine protease